MPIDELKDRELYFKEFGHIVVKRHEQNYQAKLADKQTLTVDETAVYFGRYLRAARVNANLSLAQLAAKTNISKATLTALEQGLILTDDIKLKWLKEIAKAVNGSVEDFNLILRRQASGSNLYGFINRLIPWQNWYNFSNVTLLSKPLYAVCSAVILFFVVGAISLFTLSYPAPTTLPKAGYSYGNIKAEQRLNMIKAELRLENQILILSTHLGGGSCCIH